MTPVADPAGVWLRRAGPDVTPLLRDLDRAATRRGWSPIGVEYEAFWAPHPAELELVLAGSGA